MATLEMYIAASFHGDDYVEVRNTDYWLANPVPALSRTRTPYASTVRVWGNSMGTLSSAAHVHRKHRSGDFVRSIDLDENVWRRGIGPARTTVSTSFGTKIDRNVCAKRTSHAFWSSIPTFVRVERGNRRCRS